MQNKILVVDDEKDIRDFLYRALTRIASFDVVLAETGMEALQLIEKDQFDLVLTDLKMPQIDGLELLNRISKLKPEVLTVLMTAHGTIDSALEAMKRGASDYLIKPLNLDEMIVRLQKVLLEKQRFIKLKDFALKLERANQELKRVDEMKSEFVAIASHELRTPLTSIKNAVQLILSGKTGEINEAQRKFLSMADRNINRLTNILSNLLNLSKIESGKIEMKFEEIDLRGIIEFVLSSLKPQADGKSIRLHLEGPETFPPVCGDHEKVEQILMNLIGNAIKFTPEGGKISICAKAYHGDGQTVAISVKDSGIGIPENQLDKIFEKFYQVEGSLRRSTGGTGLGLPITKGLVEAHQGKIWVESKPGEGSTFTFTLPSSKGERREPHFRFIFGQEFKRAEKGHSFLTLFLMEVFDERSGVQDILSDKLEEEAKKCLVRKGDILVRRNKEKLLAALCEADLNGAQVIRQRIEKELQKDFIEGWDKPPVIRIGAATYPDEALTKRELFRRAKIRLREKR